MVPPPSSKVDTLTDEAAAVTNRIIADIENATAAMVQCGVSSDVNFEEVAHHAQQLLQVLEKHIEQINGATNLAVQVIDNMQSGLYARLVPDGTPLEMRLRGLQNVVTRSEELTHCLAACVDELLGFEADKVGWSSERGGKVGKLKISGLCNRGFASFFLTPWSATVLHAFHRFQVKGTSGTSFFLTP